MITVIAVPAPAEFLSANDRLHWAHKARVVKLWREAAAWAVKAHRLPSYGDQLVQITATIHKPHGRRFDAANYAPTGKAAIDGCRDAGLLVDDDNDHVIGPDMRRGVASPKSPRLVLEIRTIEDREATA